MERGFVSNRRDVLPFGSSMPMIVPTTIRDATVGHVDAGAPIDPRTCNRDAEMRRVVEPSLLDLMARSHATAPKRTTLAFI